jgi:predicted nucleotide-binding protein
MPYYHVRIKYLEPSYLRETTEYELDLSEEDATTIGEQYAKGRILFNGKWIDSSSVKEIEIRETDLKSTSYYPTLNSSTIFYGDKSFVKNVTRKFIKLPPGMKEISEKHDKIKVTSSKNIFIVHGRDHVPMKELKTMLFEFGLNPIVLHEQPSGSRTIVEKLEKYSDVGYAFVILTPDDSALPDTLPIIPPFPPELPFKQRARQNVVLEFGYFIGLLGRDKVCCLHKGNVELPSDMHGIVYIPFEGSVEEIRPRIMKELKEVGYEIKI